MRKLLLIFLLLFSLNGCRISLTAEKLALYIQADEPSYLSDEDPALYDPETEYVTNPID